MTKGGEETQVEDASSLSGKANIASLTFLAARAVPLGWVVAVAGGVPLARAGQRGGTRAGYATAIASLVETMAIMGPARMGVPAPQAASAPVVGVMEGRGRSLVAMALVGAMIRFVYYLFTSAVSIFVIVGVDAYVGSYESLGDFLGFLPPGRTAALWLTVGFLMAWSLPAGLIQAWVIRRGLRRWDFYPLEETSDEVREATSPPAARKHPRSGLLVSLALLGFGVALIGLNPRVLLGLALALALAWVITDAGWRALGRGLLLAVPLAVSTLLFGLVGGIGVSAAGGRAARVALLVLIAVWVHRAAGSAGLRAQALRLVRAFDRFPTLRLAASVLASSVEVEDFGGSARRLGTRLKNARRRPTPILDASLAWLADESARPGVVPKPEEEPP